MCAAAKLECISADFSSHCRSLCPRRPLPNTVIISHHRVTLLVIISLITVLLPISHILLFSLSYECEYFAKHYFASLQRWFAFKPVLRVFSFILLFLSLPCIYLFHALVVYGHLYTREPVYAI